MFDSPNGVVRIARDLLEKGNNEQFCSQREFPLLRSDPKQYSDYDRDILLDASTKISLCWLKVNLKDQLLCRSFHSHFQLECVVL